MKRQIAAILVGLFILCMFGCYTHHIAHEQLSKLVNDMIGVTRIIVYTLAVTLTLAVIGILILFVVSVRERVLTHQAIRKQAQREAEVYAIVSETHGVFVREINSNAVWRPLHLNPTAYQNGEQTEVSAVEMATWQTWMLRNRPSATKQVEPQLLPAQTQVDLLTGLDTVHRCLIVGASDSGKTTLLQHLVRRRSYTSKVVVIDPHAYPDKWTDCVVIGTGRNYSEIDRALVALVQLMTKRYDEIGKGVVVEGNHPRLTILIDEWRAIVHNVKTASKAIKALLTESRKAAISVFVATHSDRAKPLGLEGEYDLKDGFAIVRLFVINGQRQATLDTGNGEFPATLPGLYYKNAQRVLESDELINLEVKPDTTEATILSLYDQGQPVSAIAETVFGSKGGNQNQRVKEVLAKFERV